MKKYHYSGGGANVSKKYANLLHKKYELFDTQLIPLIIKDVMNCKIESITPVTNSGIPHVTYDVQISGGIRYIFRANIGYRKPEISLLTEKFITDLVLRYGIPSNKILYVDISRKKYSFDFQIQEYLNGYDPEINFNGTVQNYDSLSHSIGQTIAKLSDIKLNGFGHFNEKLIKKGVLEGEESSFKNYIYLELEEQLKEIEENKYLSHNSAKNVIKLFDNSSSLFNIKEGNLVHYDIADHNLKYNPNTFQLEALFDWEACIIGDSMLDIASAPTWKTLYERESKLLEGYKSVKKLPENYKEKIDIYRLRTVIWKLCHNIKNNIVTPERVARLGNSLSPFKIPIN